jgi:hypothetical protein
MNRPAITLKQTKMRGMAGWNNVLWIHDCHEISV